MNAKRDWAWLASFFCLLGWVCSDPAIGQDMFDSAGSDESAEPVVQVTSYDTVSLNVQDTDLAKVLNILSHQGRRNIVPSPASQGTVTANLYDVTFYEALDAILQQNGCGYIEEGSFIYVYTAEEIQAIQEAQRSLSYKVFRFDYVTAKDASAMITPLLSESGAIVISGEVAAGFQPTIGDGGANSSPHRETMLVRDYPENLEEIEKLVMAFDVRPKQVMIEATVLKAELTDELAFGVDFSILVDVSFDQFTGGPMETVGALLGGSVDDNPALAITNESGNFANQNEGLKAAIITENLSMFIRALDKITDTTIMAHPSILTLNRQRAHILVGEKVGYLSTSATATSTTQTVEFLETGTQLAVRPFVSSDGMIRMELQPSISSAKFRDSGGFSIPDETTQELTTNIMVRSGQTIVLGGLFKEEATIKRGQIPGLGDVPWVGNLFKDRDDEFKRNEYIFLITAHIVNDESLAEAGKLTQDSAEMTRIGVREGLLPWSRDKLTASHLRDALRALDDGDGAVAMWEVDMALSLDSRHIEALRLKEKLTGIRQYAPNVSLLDEAVDHMVLEQTGQRNIRARPMVPDPAPGEPSGEFPPSSHWQNSWPHSTGETAEPAETMSPSIDMPNTPAADQFNIDQSQVSTTRRSEQEIASESWPADTDPTEQIVPEPTTNIVPVTGTDTEPASASEDAPAGTTETVRGPAEVDEFEELFPDPVPTPDPEHAEAEPTTESIEPIQVTDSIQFIDESAIGSTPTSETAEAESTAEPIEPIQVTDSIQFIDEPATETSTSASSLIDEAAADYFSKLIKFQSTGTAEATESTESESAAADDAPTEDTVTAVGDDTEAVNE